MIPEMSSKDGIASAGEVKEEVFLLIEPSKVPDTSTSLSYTIEIKVE